MLRGTRERERRRGSHVRPYYFNFDTTVTLAQITVTVFFYFILILARVFGNLNIVIEKVPPNPVPDRERPNTARVALVSLI